ncbi:MAG: M20/M25/M40 family metallo-hydrolase, partial [Verrucomicrobiota bacterium]|nr:M20/M25/M40 family metallo-hydrolase [Verrucomicrobiota bacterium]
WFTLGSDERPRLLLVSHLDTVPPCEGWQSDPNKLQSEGEKLIGLGANDAKGSVAAMIMAARELQTQELDGLVTFAFVAGEERGGEGIRAIKPKLGVIDAAIVGEPTGLEICTAQRGMLLLQCIAHGESAHVAHAQLGDNAIHKAARDVARLAAMEFPAHPSLGATRAQVTEISGGLARNQIPDRCEFFVDLRTTPNLDHAEVAGEIEGALESEVRVHSDRYLAVATEENEPIVQAALQAADKARGVGSVTTSDWAFLRGIPAVKAGPGETERSHRPNEFILLSELEAGAAFYRRAVRNYFELAAKEQAHV